MFADRLDQARARIARMTNDFVRRLPSVRRGAGRWMSHPGPDSHPMIHRFCISHKKPVLPESWYDDCISLGDFQSDSVFHVRQLDRFWHEARPIAYGAAGTHVLPVAIERFFSD